jgi:hypothetical protein
MGWLPAGSHPFLFGAIPLQSLFHPFELKPHFFFLFLPPLLPDHIMDETADQKIGRGDKQTAIGEDPIGVSGRTGLYRTD